MLSSYNDTIFKSLDSRVVFIEGEGYKASYTKSMSVDILDNLTDISMTPVLFQSDIQKMFEVRTLYIFGQIYSVKFDSSSVKDAEIDWRANSKEMTAHMQPYELPYGIEKKLSILMQKLGLGYGAIDWIVQENGTHVFLEVNTTGSWYWMEIATDQPLTRTIVSALKDKIENFSESD